MLQKIKEEERLLLEELERRRRERMEVLERLNTMVSEFNHKLDNGGFKVAASEG